MKTAIVLFMSVFCWSALLAQDHPETTCRTKKTFVIRKKNNTPTVNNKKETTTTIPAEQKIESVLYTKTETTKKEHKQLVKSTQPAKMPTLAGGEFGLMHIEPYRKKMDLKNWKYVILQYSVSIYGWATKIDVLGTNDERLSDLAIRKLKKAKWNPAEDPSGNKIEYRMRSQVVIVKDRTYEEDYFNDY